MNEPDGDTIIICVCVDTRKKARSPHHLTDMRAQNDIDRFHLVEDVLFRLPQYGNQTAHLFQKLEDKLVEHKQYIHEYGQNPPVT